MEHVIGALEKSNLRLVKVKLVIHGGGQQSRWACTRLERQTIL